MDATARPGESDTDRSTGPFWWLLGFAAFCGGLWLWRYWHLVVGARGGVHDVFDLLGNVAVSAIFVVFLLVIEFAYGKTARTRSVSISAFATIGLYFGIMCLETNLGRQVWAAELAKNQAIGEDAIARIRNYIAVHGKTPDSLADVGLVEPIELKHGDRVDELAYQRVNDAEFTIGFSYGWYWHFWDFENARWDARD
jgi:hypothetical protein